MSDVLAKHPTCLIEVTGLAVVTSAKNPAEVGVVRRFTNNSQPATSMKPRSIPPGGATAHP